MSSFQESKASTPQSAVEGYLEWLRSEIKTTSKGEGWIEIETPFLDRHNDYVVVYGRERAGRWEFSDDGRTLADLEMSGFSVNSPRREELLNLTLNGLGVRLVDDALTSAGGLGESKNAMIQAILAVGDLHMLSKSAVRSIFFEDVSTWFLHHDLHPISNVSLDGTTSKHKFDFVFPGSSRSGEKYIRLLAAPTRSKAELAAFAWIDSRSNRDADSTALAIIDDEASPDARVEETLVGYDMRPVRWSDRDTELAELLAA